MLGILGEGQTPSYAEAADGLDVFNQMQRGFFGDLIGVKLEPVAASTVTGQYGALYQGIGAAFTLTLPDNPKDGWRIGVADAALAFATFNATIARNGRLLEGAAANLTLNTNGANRVWFYRIDSGNWEREKDLALTDNIYFADDCITGVCALLAIALANEYGREPPAATTALAQAGTERLRIRYGRRGTSRVANMAPTG
jgi:hypothetical protein